MECITDSVVAKKRKLDWGSGTNDPIPKILALRYQDASVVLTNYVSWRYQLPIGLQGYTKARLLSVKLYNNYATNRLSHLGIVFDEMKKPVIGTTGNTLLSWIVPNSNYTTAGTFTLINYLADIAQPDLYIDSLSTGTLTITLYDGIGSKLTASGSPAEFFCDLVIEFL